MYGSTIKVLEEELTYHGHVITMCCIPTRIFMSTTIIIVITITNKYICHIITILIFIDDDDDDDDVSPNAVGPSYNGLNAPSTIRLPIIWYSYQYVNSRQLQSQQLYCIFSDRVPRSGEYARAIRITAASTCANGNSLMELIICVFTCDENAELSLIIYHIIWIIYMCCAKSRRPWP